MQTGLNVTMLSTVVTVLLTVRITAMKNTVMVGVSILPLFSETPHTFLADFCCDLSKESIGFLLLSATLFRNSVF